MFINKNILVTGGNGFIGSNLVDKLIDMGWDVTVIDDLSAECNDRFYFNEKAKNHVESVHRNIKRFKCKRCSHSATANADIKQRTWPVLVQV